VLASRLRASSPHRDVTRLDYTAPRQRERRPNIMARAGGPTACRRHSASIRSRGPDAA
jgi:hypothetical protein